VALHFLLPVFKQMHQFLTYFWCFVPWHVKTDNKGLWSGSFGYSAISKASSCYISYHH